jgi:hypothetical protein
VCVCHIKPNGPAAPNVPRLKPFHCLSR